MTRTTGISRDLHQPLVVRRQDVLARASLPVRDQQHTAPAHLSRFRLRRRLLHVELGVHSFPHAHRHREFLPLGADRIEPFGQKLLLLVELRPAGCDTFGDLVDLRHPASLRIRTPPRPGNDDLETSRPALTAA
ncbi:hypothetical protein [Streptomyces lasiicapitis]|uniref:hypothetical protein n=1 Tax=Streptomyces lasiicapitis TaxID=1923961 RepID=UPI0036C8864F